MPIDANVRSSVPASTPVEQQRLLELLADLDAHVRPAPPELADHAREDAGPGRLERAHADPARLAGDELVEVGAQGSEAREQAVGVAQHDVAGLGQRDRARAARPLDELEADRALERRDLLGDGRLRIAEALGRAGEGALLGDGLQGGEVARLDADESISRHDRFQSVSAFPLSIARADTTGGSNQGKDSTMAGLVIALILFVAIPALSLRYGVDSGRRNAWSPDVDWRERDPRS